MAITTFVYPPAGSITISGGATLAEQLVQTAILQDIEAGTPESLGQKTMANSAPVVLASDQSSIPVTSPSTTVSGTGGALNDTPIASTDVSNYRSINIAVTGTFNATCLFEGSNDNSTFFSVLGQQVLAATSGVLPVTSVSGAGATSLLFYVPVRFKYFRMRVSSYGSGTVNALAQLSNAGGDQLGIKSVYVAGASTVPVSQSGTWNITNVSGTVSLPTGAATEATLAAASAKLPASLGIKTAAASLSVAPASDAIYNTVQSRPATATLSNVASSATSVSLLASNTSRKFATIYNDSTQILYVKFGATASATSYTLQMPPASYYELPQPCYTGAIDGIWASANGNARLTEGT